MSKAELKRLGGLTGVLAMLENPKPSVQESAILVLTNCTQGDDAFSLSLIQSPPEKLRLLLSFLQCEWTGPAPTVQFIVTVCALPPTSVQRAAAEQCGARDRERDID